MTRTLLASVLVLGLAACQPATPVGPVTEAGQLEFGDLTLTSGEYHDSFAVSMQENQWLSVNVEAEGFDPYLIILSPTEVQSDLDDSEPGNLESVSVSMRAQESGTWDLNVTSVEPGATGTYTLTYEVTDAEPGTTATAASDDEPVVEDEAAE